MAQKQYRTLKGAAPADDEGTNSPFHTQHHSSVDRISTLHQPKHCDAVQYHKGCSLLWCAQHFVWVDHERVSQANFIHVCNRTKRLT